jgi:hypothetical protein
VSARSLLAEARAEGMVVTVDGDHLKVVRPKSEVTDKIVAQLKVHKVWVLAELAGAVCCGRRPVPDPDDYQEPVVGADSAELVLACQLCLNSPTYWKREAR